MPSLLPTRFRTALSAAIEGASLPRTMDPSAPPAEAFRAQARFHTGKYESERLGACLVLLAARGGAWHEVPWRMLRNAFMRYGRLARLLKCRAKSPPPLFEHEPVVTFVMGSGEIPVELLLIGLKHMLDHGLVETRADAAGETFVFPTPRLLKCAVTAAAPMTTERALFPLGGAPWSAPEGE